MRTFLFCAALSFAQALPALAAVKLKDSGPAQSFLFEADSKALASELNVVFRSGSLGDPKGKEGLSRLAFRSLLRGTQLKSKEEFSQELERLGAAIEVSVAPGRVILTLHSVSDNFEKAIGLLAEAVLKPALKSNEIEALREEELGYLTQELTRNNRIMRRIFRQAIFRGTPAAFPAEGTTEGMKAISPELVRSYLADRVKTGGTIFAASSSRPEAEVRSWIEKAFSGLPEGAVPSLPKVEPKPIEGRVVYIMDREGSSTTEVGLGHFGIVAAHPDRETLETGVFAFGEDMNSRTFTELRGNRGWTYGAYAGFSLFDYPRAYGGGFLFWSAAQAEFTEPLTLRMVELYDDYAKNGLTPRELSYAKKSLANSYPFQFATSRVRLNLRLYRLLEGAPARSVAEYRKIVGAVTQGSLRKAVRKVHNSKNIAIVLVGDPSRTAGLAKKIPNVKRVVKVSDPMAAFTE